MAGFIYLFCYRRPCVKFQGYWRLTTVEPDGPPETYLCSYLLEWKTQTVQRFYGTLDNCRSLFEARKQLWNKSITCVAFKSQFQQLLDKRRVTKVICFGLGDMGPTEWTMRNKSDPDNQDGDTEDIQASLTQHAMALTMAEAIYQNTGVTVQLKAQDPVYTEQTKKILGESGFEVVGEFGAGGFAEVDDESVVFTAFISAPVREILADFARPALVITRGHNSVFNPNNNM